MKAQQLAHNRHRKNKGWTAWAAVAISLSLTACSALTYDLQQTWKLALSKSEPVELSAEEVNDFPYSAQYVQLGTSPQVMLVLGFIDTVHLGADESTENTQQLTWLSGNQESISSIHSRIRHTAGLPIDLLHVSDLESDPLHCLITTPENCTTQWQRHIDYVFNSDKYQDMRANHSALQPVKEQTLTTQTNYLQTLRHDRIYRSDTLESTFTLHDQETVTLGGGHQTIAYKVIESGVFISSGDTFTNIFWVEPDGHVVKSQQQLTAESPRIIFTQAKWVGRTPVLAKHQATEHHAKSPQGIAP